LATLLAASVTGESLWISSVSCANFSENLTAWHVLSFFEIKYPCTFCKYQHNFGGFFFVNLKKVVNF
jgi:hypothetical protein